MFRKNPLVELELDYLREAFPNHWWQYLLLVPAYVIVYLPFVRPESLANHYFLMLGLVCFVVLGTFWSIQLGIMAMAVHLFRRPHTEEEDAIVADGGAYKIVMGKFWAILQHTWFWFLFFLPMLIISTRTLDLFMFAQPESIWIFDAVDTSGGYVSNNWLSQLRNYNYWIEGLSIYELPVLFLIPLFTHIASSSLSIMLGFYFASRSRKPIAIAIIGRFVLLILAAITMIVCSNLRFTWLKHVLPLSNPYTRTPPFTPFEENARLALISLEVSASTLIDNSILGITVISGCLWEFRSYSEPFVVRNLIAIGIGIIGQLGLADFLLWRTSLRMGKKKK